MQIPSQYIWGSLLLHLRGTYWCNDCQWKGSDRVRVEGDAMLYSTLVLKTLKRTVPEEELTVPQSLAINRCDAVQYAEWI